MPLEQDILQVGFDYKQTQADAEKVIASLKSVLDYSDKFSSLQDVLSKGGGFATSKKGAEELGKTIKENTAILDNYNKTLIANAKAQVEQAKAATEAQKQITEGAKQQTEASKRLTESSKQETEQSKQSATAKLTDAKAATERSKQVATAKLAEAKAITESAKARDIEAKTTIAYNKENDRTVSAIAKEEKALEALASDYKVLSLAQKDAIARYQNLVLLVGKDDPVARAAGKEAAALTDQLKSVDEATHVYTRNVGNYGGAIVKAFSGAFSFLRTIAYILPGIGIAGILGGIVDVVVSLTSAIFSGTNALNTLAENYKNVNEVVANANKTAGKQIVDLQILYSAAINVNNSIDQRRAAVKALKEEFPDYFGKIDDEIILNGKAKKSYDELRLAIVASARASAAKAKIDDLERQRLDSDFQKQKIKIATENERRNAQAKIDANVQTDEFGNQLKVRGELEFVQTAINQREVKGLRDEDLKQQSLDQQEKFLINFVGEKNITKVVVDEQTKRDKKKKEVKSIADEMRELENALKGIQSEQDNGILNIHEADVKRAEKIKSTIEEIFKLTASDADKNKAAFDLSVRLNPISLRLLNDQIKEFAEKNPANKLDLLPPPEVTKKALDDRLNDIHSFVDGEAKLFDEVLQREIAIQETASLEEQRILLDKFNTGKINREQYESDLLGIQLKYARKAALTSIDYLEKEVSLYEIGTKAREDAEKRLAAARLAISKGLADEEKKNREKVIKEIEEIRQKTLEIVDVIGGFINIGVTKQKNALRELEDQQQKNYDNEVARINASTLSDAEKADKLKILEAQRQTQKEAFDRKNREADKKKAAFDKAAAIANIILNTAAAIAKVLYDPFQVAFAAAIGAAQLAIAIATPLPKYAKGIKNNPKDHFGIYGDVPEIVDMPGRQPFLADKETVGFIPKGTNITPVGRDEINNIMHRSMVRQTSATINSKTNKSEMLLSELLKETRKNNGKRIEFNARIKYDTSWDSYKRKYYS
jgi:hypothetical protein